VVGLAINGAQVKRSNWIVGFIKLLGPVQPVESHNWMFAFCKRKVELLVEISSKFIPELDSKMQTPVDVVEINSLVKELWTSDCQFSPMLGISYK
jgi:hypothetical protein